MLSGKLCAKEINELSREMKKKEMVGAGDTAVTAVESKTNTKPAELSSV